jgi:hypothetical protein
MLHLYKNSSSFASNRRLRRFAQTATAQLHVDNKRINTPLTVALQKVTEFFSAVGVSGCDFNNYGNIVN